MPTRILPRDQHGQLERVEQAQLRKLSRRSRGRDHIPALDRLLEDSVRTALRGRRLLLPGAGRPLESRPSRLVTRHWRVHVVASNAMPEVAFITTCSATVPPDFDESASAKLPANAHASLQHAHGGPNTLLLCLSPQKTQESASRQDHRFPAADGGLKGQVPHQRWCPSRAVLSARRTHCPKYEGRNRHG